MRRIQFLPCGQSALVFVFARDIQSELTCWCGENIVELRIRLRAFDAVSFHTFLGQILQKRTVPSGCEYFNLPPLTWG